MGDIVSDSDMLVKCLADIMMADQMQPEPDYAERNLATWKALGFAAQLGYQVGFDFDPAEPEWPVAMIQLPTGQVSWHTPRFPQRWDGHTTEEKYRRLGAYIEWVKGPVPLEDGYVGRHRPETVVPV